MLQSWLAAEWGSSSLIRNVETPIILILSCSSSTCLPVQACLFVKQCLACQWHTWWTLTTDIHACMHTHAPRTICLVLWCGWVSSYIYVCNVLDPYCILALLLYSCWECKYLICSNQRREIVTHNNTNFVFHWMMEWKGGEECKKNTTERAASFIDQSVIREFNKSTLSSLNFSST